jgi:hypothetical protein
MGCELWPLGEIESLNLGYGVPKYAPGYLGFGSNGGGEMFAFGPKGAIVCLAFVGMNPAEEMAIADSWESFQAMLQPNPDD